MSGLSLFPCQRPEHILCRQFLFHALLLTLLALGGLWLPDMPTPAAGAAQETAAIAGRTPEEVKAESPAAGENAAVPEPAEPAVNAAWEAMWSGQRAMIDEVRQTALKLSDSFGAQTANLSRQLQPFEEEGHRLLVFANTFKGYPNAMEAVSRRIAATIGEFQLVLGPVTVARSEAQSLLERVNYMAASLPDEMQQGNISQEMRAYAESITRARLRLTAVLAQYDSLIPSLQMLTRLEEARNTITAQMPVLWKDYYLQGPTPWLSPDAWADFSQRMFYSWQAMLLRLPVELPTTTPQWGTAGVRFVICLVFTGILALLLQRRWLMPQSPPPVRHLFRRSLPWLCLGLALLGSALSAYGDFFRLFLALGNLCLILGQIFLAWDLRQLQYPEAPAGSSPLLRLLPLTLGAYALLYLPLIQPLVLVIWTVFVICTLWQRRKKATPTLGPFRLEYGALECEPGILWICLFLALTGLHIYSIATYLLFVSLSLALQLCRGGMALVSSINERLPREGAGAALARLAVALAAPVVLVVVVVGVLLWVGTLPGGTYLLGEYAFKGVSVGQTQLNIIQALLIISVFFLTRTVVSMGTRFLARLPAKGLNFDATLIPPLQTALTYAAWAIFGLFVLRALGLELSNLAMVAGGLSVGIGFGMQTIVNNFLSGLILIFSRTLQAGDVVEVGGITGKVRKISVRATMVETYDNALIYVPNSEFVANRLINWTRFSRSVRRQVDVGVAYGSDTAEVARLLISVAKAHENVLRYPAPSVIFVNFGASSLDFALRFWVKDFEMGAGTASDIRLGIEKLFREAHIEIAFPQLDVHVKDLPPRAGSPRPPAPRPAEAPTLNRADTTAPVQPVGRRIRPRPLRRAASMNTRESAPFGRTSADQTVKVNTDDKSQTA